MITQSFKGDSRELQMEAAAAPAFEVCGVALDAFLAGGYSASDFLLMLYDEGRMPFSDRVPRDSFLAFIKQAIPNFPVTGTFESYIFILQAIFGAGSGVLFELSDPGKLAILVNAASSIDFEAIAREFSDGQYEIFDLITDDGDQILFGGISGIDSEAELSQLLAELIPAGIVADITLDFFALYSFAAEYIADGELFDIVDHLGNSIVFFEEGG